MKNKFYTTFGALLFTGLLLFGAVCSGGNSPDVTDRLCYRASGLPPGPDVSFLPGAYKVYDGKMPCSAPPGKGVCCTKRPCNTKTAPFLNTHFQNPPVPLMVTVQKPQDRNNLPGPAPAPHYAIPAVPIYTLTRSYRC
ncbi:MAG: hypothetical protein KKC20_18615 [Proteobacteria bacterium]|nr:hypothetical protein [Pseudomonadota bacterium]